MQVLEDALSVDGASRRAKISAVVTLRLIAARKPEELRPSTIEALMYAVSFVYANSEAGMALSLAAKSRSDLRPMIVKKLDELLNDLHFLKVAGLDGQNFIFNEVPVGNINLNLVHKKLL
jgi:hypothetical protein